MVPLHILLVVLAHTIDASRTEQRKIKIHTSPTTDLILLVPVSARSTVSHKAHLGTHATLDVLCGIARRKIELVVIDVLLHPTRIVFFAVVEIGVLFS